MTTAPTPAKRGPGRPRKAPTVLIVFRIDAQLAERFRQEVAPHDRRPWLENRIRRAR